MGELMARVDTWEKRLAALIEDHRHVPFEWGANDCLTFADTVHFELTGRRLCADWLDGAAYTDAKSALRVYAARRKGETIIEGLDGRLTRGTGFPPRGSIVATPSAELVFGVTLGVAIGPVAAFVGDLGLEFRPITDADIWWHV